MWWSQIPTTIKRAEEEAGDCEEFTLSTAAVHPRRLLSGTMHRLIQKHVGCKHKSQTVIHQHTQSLSESQWCLLDFNVYLSAICITTIWLSSFMKRFLSEISTLDQFIGSLCGCNLEIYIFHYFPMWLMLIICWELAITVSLLLERNYLFDPKETIQISQSTH